MCCIHCGVAELADEMLRNEQTNTFSQLQCMNSDFLDDTINDHLSTVIYGIPSISENVSGQLQTTLITNSRQVCIECLNPLRNVITYNHFLKLLIFSVGGHRIDISKYIKIKTNGKTKKFHLKGIVYYGGFQTLFHI